MSTSRDYQSSIRLATVDGAAVDDSTPQALHSGGGGGTSDGMEGRVASLEAHMEHVRADVGTLKTDVGAIKTDIAVMKEQIKNLPTKAFIIVSVLGIGSLLTGITVFQTQIKALFGLH